MDLLKKANAAAFVSDRDEKMEEIESPRQPKGYDYNKMGRRKRAYPGTEETGVKYVLKQFGFIQQNSDPDHPNQEVFKKDGYTVYLWLDKRSRTAEAWDLERPNGSFENGFGSGDLTKALSVDGPLNNIIPRRIPGKEGAASPQRQPAQTAPPAQPQPAPEPVESSLIKDISSGGLAAMVKALVGMKEFEDDKAAQQLIENMTAELLTRPVEPEEAEGNKTSRRKRAFAYPATNQETAAVLEGALPEVTDAHKYRDDKTDVKRPDTVLPASFSKSAATITERKDGYHVIADEKKPNGEHKHLGGPYKTKEEAETRLRDVEWHKDHPKKGSAALTAAQALKKAEETGKKLSDLYLDTKPITAVNNTRPVREAVENIYTTSKLFDEAIKTLNKQVQAEEIEEEEVKAVEKRSHLLGLKVAAEEHGFYVDLSFSGGSPLTITATPNGQEYAQHLLSTNKSTEDGLYQMLQDYTEDAQGTQDWFWVRPEFLGALTSAPILLHAATGRLYSDSQYAIRDAIQDLSEGRPVKFAAGGIITKKYLPKAIYALVHGTRSPFLLRDIPGKRYRPETGVIASVDDEDDTPRLSCDQCNMLSIQGIPCHETGCPNQGKEFIDGRWVKPNIDTDFDDYDDEDDDSHTASVPKSLMTGLKVAAAEGENEDENTISVCRECAECIGDDLNDGVDHTHTYDLIEKYDNKHHCYLVINPEEFDKHRDEFKTTLCEICGTRPFGGRYKVTVMPDTSRIASGKKSEEVLPSTQDDEAIRAQVEAAAKKEFGKALKEVFFEHGHWWARVDHEAPDGDPESFYDVFDTDTGFNFERTGSKKFAKRKIAEEPIDESDTRKPSDADIVKPDSDKTLILPVFTTTSGLRNYMPGSLGFFTSKESAVDSIAEMFELGENQIADLEVHDFIDLDPHEDGAEYAEISAEECTAIWNNEAEHWDVQTPFGQKLHVDGDPDDLAETVAAEVVDQLNQQS